MEISALELFGLTRNEALIYMTLLRFGELPAGQIAQETGLHRSRVYEALAHLEKEGFVLTSRTEHGRRFSAATPHILQQIIEEKRAVAAELIPQLLTLATPREENSFLRARGYRGLRTIFEEMLHLVKPGEEILVFGARSGQDVAPQTWDAFFENFNNRRIEKGIKYKIIFNEDLRGNHLATTFNQQPLTEVRFLKQHTLAGINIHHKRVAIVVWQKEPLAFLITHTHVADSFRQFFKHLWAEAKP